MAITVLDKLLKGEADMQRLTEYADWVEMLFQYSDKSVLLTGNYDAQVGQFATKKSVYLFIKETDRSMVSFKWR